jgi:hypothetical protein
MCNMDSKLIPRGRGRPAGSVKLLATDPWRYLYALSEATIQRNDAVDDAPSELGICTFFATFKERYRPLKAGEFVVGHEPVTEHFHSRWRQGLPFRVVHPQWDSMPPHGRAVAHETYEQGDRWRDKARINAKGEDIQRMLRGWRVEPSPNRQWLMSMATAMKICVAGHVNAGWLADALTGDIGESKYFKETLWPIMTEHAALLRTGKDIQNISLERLFGLIKSPL